MFDFSASIKFKIIKSTNRSQRSMSMLMTFFFPTHNGLRLYTDIEMSREKKIKQQLWTLDITLRFNWHQNSDNKTCFYRVSFAFWIKAHIWLLLKEFLSLKTTFVHHLHEMGKKTKNNEKLIELRWKLIPTLKLSLEWFDN